MHSTLISRTREYTTLILLGARKQLSSTNEISRSQDFGICGSKQMQGPNTSSAHYFDVKVKKGSDIIITNANHKPQEVITCRFPTALKNGTSQNIFAKPLSKSFVTLQVRTISSQTWYKRCYRTALQKSERKHALKPTTETEKREEGFKFPVQQYRGQADQAN